MGSRLRDSPAEEARGTTNAITRLTTAKREIGAARTPIAACRTLDKNQMIDAIARSEKPRYIFRYEASSWRYAQYAGGNAERPAYCVIAWQQLRPAGLQTARCARLRH